MARILLLLFLALFIGPVSVEAYTPVPPEEDGVCWAEKLEVIERQHPPDRSGDVLAHLLEYVDTNNYEAVLADPVIKDRMNALLRDERCHLLQNLLVGPGVGVANGYIVLQGNAPHNGGLENAILLARISDGAVYIAIFSEGEIRVFSQTTQYRHLPSPMRHWIEWWQLKERFKKPSNVYLEKVE